MRIRIKLLISLLLALLSLVLVRLAKSFPLLVENIYSRVLYPIFAKTAGLFTGLFPFSIAQLLVVAAPLLLIVWTILVVRSCIRHRGKAGERLLRFASSLILIASAGYLAFILCCGLNYYRCQFSYYTQLETRPSSAQELEDLCTALAVKTNALREQAASDEQGIMRLSFGRFSHLAEESKAAYRRLGEQYPVLAGRYSGPKPVLFSRIMSYLNITGVYFPFTYESNVNTDVPDFSLPATVCHELAHLRGFMREDEANYIAYLACDGSESADFQYSGAMLALNHSLNSLYKADRDAYGRVIGLLSQPVRADMADNGQYWAQFEGKAAEVSTKVNNAYLHSNNQAAGVASYGEMVDLLLAQYRETGHI